MAVLISLLSNIKPQSFYFGGKMQRAIKASLLLTTDGYRVTKQQKISDLCNSCGSYLYRNLCKYRKIPSLLLLLLSVFFGVLPSQVLWSAFSSHPALQLQWTWPSAPREQIWSHPPFLSAHDVTSAGRERERRTHTLLIKMKHAKQWTHTSQHTCVSRTDAGGVALVQQQREGTVTRVTACCVRALVRTASVL